MARRRRRVVLLKTGTNGAFAPGSTDLGSMPTKASFSAGALTPSLCHWWCAPLCPKRRPSTQPCLQERCGPDDQKERVERLPNVFRAAILRLGEDEEYHAGDRGRPEPERERAQEGEVQRVLSAKVIEQPGGRRSSQAKHRRGRPAVFERGSLGGLMRRPHLAHDPAAVQRCKVQPGATCIHGRLQYGQHKPRSLGGRKKAGRCRQLEEVVGTAAIGRKRVATALEL
eukprot:scaffold252743_cov29-Tisochrysis_lutea.AAC.4